MNHIDLFSGIGGFSLAALWVWPDHNPVLFCEREPFCQKVLRKHWPNVPIVEDVNDLERIVAYTKRHGWGVNKELPQEDSTNMAKYIEFTIKNIDLLTGGFPCQPFSTAGQRKGTEDDRALWPAMLAAIRAIGPRWVLAENVPGLLSIDGGLVFERVCLDLEDAGYEVLSLVIPACSQNAPHRRDRVWIVARNTGSTQSRGLSSIEWKKDSSVRKSDQDASNTQMWQRHEANEAITITNERNTWKEHCRDNWDAPDSCNQRLQGREQSGTLHNERDRPEAYGPTTQRNSAWDEHWYEAALRTCNVRVDDGLSGGVDRHRTGRLKALGNAIVPQVVVQIFKAIKTVDEGIENDKL